MSTFSASLTAGQPVAIHSFDVNTSWNSSAAFADSPIQFNVPNVTGKTYAVEASGLYWYIVDAGNYVVWQWEGSVLGSESAQHGWQANPEENGFYHAVPPYARGGFSPNEVATIQALVGVNTKLIYLACPIVVKVYEET